MNQKPKIGRPKSEGPTRDVQVSFFLTETEANELTRLSESLGFKSRSTMIGAVMERLLIGGFSGFIFARVGWMFANLITEKKVHRGFYFGGPLPPLIGDEQDLPDAGQIVPFLEELKKEAKKEKAA